MIDYALDLASRGFTIFPCHYPIITRTSTTCSCGKKTCKNIGKHPAITDWPNLASKDETIVKALWQRDQNYNIAILTGLPNNLDVLDYDPKHQGDKSLQQLEDENEPFPPTVRSKTGSGGGHIFFQHTQGLRNNNTGKIKPGIDFKTTGGYVIGPPSLHMSGNRYEWLIDNIQPAPPPPWFIDILRREFPPAHKRKPRDIDFWNSIARGVPKDGRHEAILAVAGLLLEKRSKVKSKALAMTLIHGFNEIACIPPKTQKEVNSIIEYVLEKQVK